MSKYISTLDIFRIFHLIIYGYLRLLILSDTYFELLILIILEIDDESKVVNQEVLQNIR
jgi:hypothetical protein